MNQITTKNAKIVATKLPLEKLVTLLTSCCNSYHNSGESLVSDDVYDILFAILRERDPSHPFLSQTRFPVLVKEKVKLPVWMGGLAKVYNEKDLKRFRLTCPVLVSDKLDGVSCLVDARKGIHLYTGGDGKFGLEITAMLPYLKVDLKKAKGMVLRGELIISKSVFEEKYGKDYKNPRNFVSGVVTSLTIDDDLKGKLGCLDLIFYEVIEPWLPQREQFQLIQTIGISCVRYQMFDKIDLPELASYLVTRREISDYKMDGLVITSDEEHDRCEDTDPTYSFAFKVNELGTVCTVTEVEWSPSKDGLLIPKIKIEPYNDGEVTISQMSGHNAKFIIDNRIGIGSQIRVIRSGLVIPYCQEVLEPSPYGCQLPKIKYVKKGVHFVLEEMTDEVEIKRIAKFLSVIGVEHLGEGMVTKLYQGGYDTIKKVISITTQQLLQLEGVQQKLAEKIHNNIQSKLKDIEISTLLDASNLFTGYGEKRIKKLVDEIPDVMEKSVSRDEIMAIEGYSDITADAFLVGLPKFMEFYREIKDLVTIKEMKVVKGEKYKGMSVLMTGFRSEEMKKAIEDGGGKVTESVSKKTSLVIYKDGEVTSSKYLKAVSLGVKVVPKSEFKI